MESNHWLQDVGLHRRIKHILTCILLLKLDTIVEESEGKFEVSSHSDYLVQTSSHILGKEVLPFILENDMR